MSKVTVVFVGMLLIEALSASDFARACTTFALRADRILAKSYDWHMDHGLLLVNKRGVEKHGFALAPTDVPPTWTSRFGSVTFNQYGREFPNAGLNEAGLVVEVMVLEDSRFPEATTQPSLNETQWVQYQLDRFDSVAEVVRHAQEVRIAPALQPLHYMVCDRIGECASLEYVDGALRIQAGASMDIQVLANDTYIHSREYLRRFAGFGGQNPIPARGMGSLTRFVRAADHVRQGPRDGSPVAYAFAGLEKVAGPTTQWRIAYEMATGAIHFASLSAPAIKTIRTANLDFACSSPVGMLDVGTQTSGDATSLIVAYDPMANDRMVHASLDGLLPAAVISRALTFPATTHCADL